MEIAVYHSSSSTKPNSPNSKVIQQVSKASSDQVLNKFAEIDSENETASSASKRRLSLKKSMKKKKKTTKKKVFAINKNVEELGSSSNDGGSVRMVERKSLLPNNNNDNSKRCSSRGGLLLFKQFGVSRSSGHYYVRGVADFRAKSLLSAIDKTWTIAIRGASRVFVEKHYNRHRILIDDIV